ncbi:helix-turn-helix domain-containing protein [Microbacterium sp. SCN 69-37]|uniref:helix-turn-helix transcriptional regulator n=1 Tax=Microbacterium sp. SCN 69-37 TaxID=1660115 RepID=UPI00086F4952|nr:helix-turn-helix domain-containing protein [Microbacterium sp. SCN 69-37]ODT25794.1 MAG: hypothetical protein ABS64_00825 [Microbacterium sp. SCN 69-37]
MVSVLQLQVEDPEHTFLTPQELAEQLGLCVSRLSAWRQHGGGPAFVKLGRSVIYKVADIERWLEASTRSSTAEAPLPRGRRVQ